MTLPTLIPILTQIFADIEPPLWIETHCGGSAQKIFTIIRKILLLLLWGACITFFLIILMTSDEVRIPIDIPSQEWKIFGLGVVAIIFMSVPNWVNFSMCSKWDRLRTLSELARGITKYSDSIQGLPQNTDLTLQGKLLYKLKRVTFS